MKVSKIPGLGDYGVFIDGVDFAKLTDEEWIEIGNLHIKNLVTIIRDCNLRWQDMTDRLVRFGDTRYGIRYNILKKYPNKTWSEVVRLSVEDSSEIDEVDKARLSNISRMQEVDPKTGKHVMRVSGKKDENGHPVGMFAEGELLWHSNESGTLTFTPGVALLAEENVVGSCTGFLQTASFYENISETFRSELDDMILIHKFTPGRINPGLRGDQDEVMHANMCPEDDTEIPMVIRSPGNIVGLHYSINTVDRIKGLTHKQSEKVFEEINRQLFVDDYMYDHWYENDGDLCLFDNSITLHRRLGETTNRLCYRVQHDYSNLQEDFWQPYFQAEYSKKYEEEIYDFVTSAGIRDFKLPASYQ
jgi:alpha-ketoglutarate-dependent taurine dioxygenase